MIFGKHINRYYLKYAGWLIMGLAALVAVDYFQLVIPNLYQMVINGLNQGYVLVDGVKMAFDMNFLLDKICMPLVWVILAMVIGRFGWRVCIFGAAIKVETDLRNDMFDHAKDLSDVSAAFGPVPYPHGIAAGGQHGGWQLPHQKVGHPSGGLLQAVRLFPGELLRHRRHQGLREGSKRIAGLPDAE